VDPQTNDMSSCGEQGFHGGYTKVNKCVDVSAGHITDHNLFLVGDIFLAVLHSGCTLSIGVLHSIAVSLNNILCASINVTIMKALQHKAKITSQLLSLMATNPSPDGDPLSFLWDGGYVKAHSLIQDTLDHTKRVIMVTVPGSLVEPVNPKATFIRLRDNINTDKFTQVNSGQSTWKISQDIMQAACEFLWACQDHTLGLSDPKGFGLSLYTVPLSQVLPRISRVQR
jgi:hypothetical protein